MSTATERISWFPVPDESELPEDLQGLFRAARERIGFVPNVFRAYSFRPERLSAWFQHFRLVMEGTPGLTEAEREMIAVVVSMANGCLYCLVAHGAALRQAWGDPVMADRITLDWRRAEGLTERQRAMRALGQQRDGQVALQVGLLVDREPDAPGPHGGEDVGAEVERRDPDAAGGAR